MKNKKMITLLLILAFLSLFTGFAINGNYATLAQYTFIDEPEMFYLDITKGKKGEIGWINHIHGFVLLLSNLAVLSLPFLYERIKKTQLLFYIPLLFILCELLFLTIFSFVLLPFIIIWIIILILQKKQLT